MGGHSILLRETYLAERPVLCNGGLFDIAIHPHVGTLEICNS